MLIVLHLYIEVPLGTKKDRNCGRRRQNENEKRRTERIFPNKGYSPRAADWNTVFYNQCADWERREKGLGKCG